MINNANEFMVAFAVMCAVIGFFVVFVDFSFGKKPPKMAKCVCYEYEY